MRFSRLFRQTFVAVIALSLTACTADAPPNVPVPVKVPAGSRLQVALIDPVSTSDSVAGDRFTASLAQPLIVDGQTILQKGTRVTGSIADVHEAGDPRGRASLMLVLQSIEQDGEDISIATRPLVAAVQPKPGWSEGAWEQGDLYYPPETRLNFTLTSELETPPAIP